MSILIVKLITQELGRLALIVALVAPVLVPIGAVVIVKTERQVDKI
jgi:hypothetical protein